MSVIQSQLLRFGSLLQTPTIQSMPTHVFNTEWISELSKRKTIFSYATSVTETHVLGVDTVEVFGLDGVTWIHREHLGNHSVVALDAQDNPIATVDLSLDSHLVPNLNTTILKNDVWLVIPQRGLLHLEVPLSNVLEQE